MADIKISELLPASTPLDGTETLPIVQSGNTVKASTQDIASLYSLGYTAENVTNKSTDTSFAGASDFKYPSQLAVKTYVDNTLGNAGWSLNGNSGTTSSNFIGTTDSADFVIKRNNLTRFKATTATTNHGELIGVGGMTIYSNLYDSGFTYPSIDLDANNSRIQITNISQKTVSIYADQITDTRSLTLPNKSGTLAIEDYKVYTALLTISSGTYTVKILKNTTESSITFSTLSAGSGLAQAVSGSSIFTADKVWAISSTIESGYFVSIVRVSGTQLFVKFRYHDGTATGIPNVNDLPIEIRVYN